MFASELQIEKTNVRSCAEDEGRHKNKIVRGFESMLLGRVDEKVSLGGTKSHLSVSLTRQVLFENASFYLAVHRQPRSLSLLDRTQYSSCLRRSSFV